MKKLMVVAIAGLLVFAFAGTVLAFDEEDDIRKKHEDWLGKVMVGQVNSKQLKAESDAQERKEGYIDTYVSADIPDKVPSSDTPLGVAINYLVENYDPYSYEFLGSRGTGKKDNLIIYSFNVNIGRKPSGHSEIIEIAVTCLDTLEVREWNDKEYEPIDTPSYGRNPETKEEKKWVKDVTKEVCETLGVDKKDVNFVGLSRWATNGGTWGDIFGSPKRDMPSGYQLAFIVDGKLYLYRAYGIGSSGTLKEVPYFSTGLVREAQLIKVPGEPMERKELEAQLMLKRGGVPTVPQMADQPREAIPLQKKQ